MPSRLRHSLSARVHPRINACAEAHGAPEHRRELLAEVSGRVLEVGAGTGAAFPHYPSAVEQVIAVEPEPAPRRLTRRATTQTPVPVDVRPGRAEELPGRQVRDRQPTVPAPEMRLQPGDELLVVSHAATEQEIHAAFR